MKWQISTLGEIVKNYGGKIQTGPFGSQLHQYDYKPEGTPVVMPKNIVNDKVDTTSIARISESDADRLSKHKLNIGDLILPRRGDLNKRAICKQENEGWLCGTGCLKIRLNDVIVDPSYLYYYFSLSHVVENILNKAVGSTMLNLSGSILSSTELVYPALPTQRKIASILSAYDDLIENNLKRIKLLEERAEIIFRTTSNELTNHQKIKLYDFADIQMGYAFNAQAFNDLGDGIPIIRIRDIPNQITKSYTTQEVEPHYFVEKGDLLIGMDGKFHMNEWLGQKGYLVQRVCRLRAKNPLFQSYLWQALKEPIHYYETTISGATVAHLGKKHLEEIVIHMPSQSMNSDMEQLNLMTKLKINLSEQNTKLREARDILLPKLMNGQIEV